jgi:uncharacterized protein
MNEEDRVIAAATEYLGTIFAEANVCESHGIDHAIDVTRIVDRALRCDPGNLTISQRLAIRLATTLHDADDSKLFPGNDTQNARAVLARLRYNGHPFDEDTIALVLRMIGWVSASKNGDAIPAEAVLNPWMLMPRYADRVTAMGHTGVKRCWKYTRGIKRPLYTPETARAVDEEDLWSRIATSERYAAYRGQSASMIDHYYDKLLHLGRALMEQDNAYFRLEARRRNLPLIEVALAFGRDGTLSDELYERAKQMAKREAKGEEL